MQKYSYRMRVFFKPIYIFICFALFLSSCSTIKRSLITYDSNVDLYKYQINKKNAIFLRNKEGKLIDSTNFNAFNNELNEAKSRYPFAKRIESGGSLKNSDTKIVKLYSEINSDIKNKKYLEAHSKIEQLKNIYPEIVKYSDCLFLEGVVLEHVDSAIVAKRKYRDFLELSSSKFSEKFRGYRDADKNDSLLAYQRKYSKAFIDDTAALLNNDCLKEISPKFHYNSFQPGYGLNTEDLPRGSNWLFMVIIGFDYVNQIGYGAQIYKHIENRVDFNIWGLKTPNSYGFGAALPIQIYKSANNNLGFKISPFLDYAYVGTVKENNIEYDINSGLFFMGAKMSGGYYFNQKFSIGAYFTYSYFEIQNSNIVKKRGTYTDYDCSLFYNMYKGFSLKAGVKNSDFVFGFFWGGWEFSYDISNPAFILRVSLF